MITASRVQIAVDLADCEEAQDVFDQACPGVFDVTTFDRTLWADAGDPSTATCAVAQGDVDQEAYAVLAALALPAGINHLGIGFWVDNVYTAAPQAGTLWAALGIVPLVEMV